MHIRTTSHSYVTRRSPQPRYRPSDERRIAGHGMAYRRHDPSTRDPDDMAEMMTVTDLALEKIKRDFAAKPRAITLLPTTCRTQLDRKPF